MTNERDLPWNWTDELLQALADFLSRHNIMSGPLTSKAIGDGHSNLTFLISNGAQEVVVRRPPPPPLPPGAHDMLREAKFLEALHSTGFPVAKVLATAKEDEVLDVPFYVMTFADGHVVTTETPAPLANTEERRRISRSMVDTLARLHNTDYDKIGLAKMGRPEGFNARHLKRIAQLIMDESGQLPEAFADLYVWLEAKVPAESGAAIVHNDFRIGNMIIAADAPGRVEAVLDWELATLGDPLLDLGYFLSSVPEPGHARTPTEDLGAAMLEDGYLSRTELAKRYAKQTGTELSNLAWYISMALWKVAALYEYSRRRAENGAGDEYYLSPGLVDAFLSEARETAGLVTSSKKGV